MLGKRITKDKSIKDNNNYERQYQQRMTSIEIQQHNSINMINNLLQLYNNNDEDIQQQNDNDIISLQVDELDELVDVKLSEYVVRVVQSSVRDKLQKEIEEKFPQVEMHFGAKMISQFYQGDNCNPHNDSVQTYLQMINTIVTPCLEHMDIITQQNEQLKRICQHQHLYIKKTQKQMTNFKNKYLELATQFNQFKVNSREIQNKYLMEINQQERLLRQYREEAKMLQGNVEEKDQRIKRLQQDSEQKALKLVADFQTYHQLDFTLFTHQITQLITDEIVQLNHQNTTKSTQNIQTQTISTITNIIEKNKSLRNQIQCLKTTLQSTNQLVMEMNQLDDYEVKVLRKDLTKSHQIQYEQCDQDVAIDVEGHLMSTIKNQFIEKVKENKHLKDQCKTLEEENKHSQRKIDQLMKFISSKSFNYELKEQPISVKLEDSPIQLIQQKVQDTQFGQNQAQDQVKEFDIDQNIEEISQKTNIANEKSQKVFNLIEEILVLRQENKKLIKQMETLKNKKTQKLSQNIVDLITQHDQQKTMGKIKRFSIDTTSTNNNCTKQNHQKQNETKQYNHEDKTSTQKDHQQSVKNLQKKVNQYKQSIVNLNEIINYMINQLRGYSCGRLFNEAQAKYNANKQKSTNRNNSNMPVRKFSYLENQINTQESENLTNQASMNSFATTLKGSSISKTQKVAGKIANLNEKRNSQALTDISVGNIKENRTLQKPSITAQNETKPKSQLLAKQVLKQKYENFQFIRKLSIKEKKCKQLLNKFHIYLDFYVDQISNLQKNIDQQSNFQDQNQTENWQKFSEYGSSYPYLKTNYSKKFKDIDIDVESESWNNLPRHNQIKQCRRKVGTFNMR